MAVACGAAAIGVAIVAAPRVEPPSDGVSVAGKAAPQRKAASPSGLAGIGLTLPARPALSASGTDLFSTSGGDAPLGSPARGVPRRPVVPPLPYRFIGRVYQDGAAQTFVARGPKVIAVKKGDLLDGEYRIDGVSGTELAFTYLPTGSRQVMQLTPPIEEENRVARDAHVPQAAPQRPALLNWNDSLTLEHQARPAPGMLE